MQVPNGFERVEIDGVVIVLRDALREPLLEAGVQDPAALVEASPSAMRGRGRLARLDLGEAGSLVVRALQRGGLLGKLVRRLSLDPARAFSELKVSAEAAERGASVLEVVAAVTRATSVGYHHGLVTREVEGARDLVTVLREEAAGAGRRRALCAAGGAIKRLHDAGVDHVDLNLKNVLLAPDGRAIVIDLDRCTIGPDGVSWAVRERNLLRLFRSWCKLAVAEPGTIRPRDPLWVARAYAAGDREVFKRLVGAGARSSFALHRLRWFFFRPRFP